VRLRAPTPAGPDGCPRWWAAYFATFAERARERLAGSDLPVWHAQMTREYLNLRAAYNWAMAGGDTVTAARIVLGVQRHWWRRWHFREGWDWHHRLLTTTTGRPLPDDLRAWVLNSAAFMAVMQDDYAAARPLGEESLRLGHQLDDPDLITSTLNVVGLINRTTGDLDRTRDCFSECIAIQRARGGNDRVLASALGNLAFLLVKEEQLDQARDLLAASIELDRKVGSRRGLAISLVGLGSVEVDRGDAAGARPLLTEGLDISRQIGDVFTQAYSIHISRPAGLVGG
jgi:tetratricopeptide (TPR) repeat protein